MRISEMVQFVKCSYLVVIIYWLGKENLPTASKTLSRQALSMWELNGDFSIKCEQTKGLVWHKLQEGMHHNTKYIKYVCVCAYIYIYIYIYILYIYICMYLFIYASVFFLTSERTTVFYDDSGIF